MQVGETQQATVQVFSGQGARMAPGSYSLTWSSRGADVLSVDSRSGALRASGPGTAWLVATAGNARDSVQVTVAAVPAPVAAVSVVEIVEADFSAEVGSSRVFSVSVLDGAGQPVVRAVDWSSSDPEVATVDADGRVTLAAPGAAMITASAAGFSDQVRVTARPAPPILPSLAEVRTAVERYVAALDEDDREAVTALWGGADSDGLEELLGLMRERDFTPTLGAIAAPVSDGQAATISFQVAATYRTSFGQNRSRELNLLGRLERTGSEWRLTRVVVP
jgi:hypothetical protein